MSDIPKNDRAPLEGVRVLAVEQFGAGPWGSMMMADLGAEVIKIENPATDGDVARYIPPYTGDQDSVYFQSFNRNKQSMTLNLQDERGQAIFKRLVGESDCVCFPEMKPSGTRSIGRRTSTRRAAITRQLLTKVVNKQTDGDRVM